MKAYDYIGQCDSLRRDCNVNEEHWQKMMKLKTPTSFKIFLASVDMSPLIDDQQTPEEYIADALKADPTTKAYKSVWNNNLAMFLQTHGFEFIFVRNNMKANHMLSQLKASSLRRDVLEAYQEVGPELAQSVGYSLEEEMKQGKFPLFIAVAISQKTVDVETLEKIYEFLRNQFFESKNKIISRKPSSMAMSAIKDAGIMLKKDNVIEDMVESILDEFNSMSSGNVVRLCSTIRNEYCSYS